MATVFQKCKKATEDPCTKARCGHAWTVRYREPGGRAGRQREKTFPVKKEAVDYGVKMENDKRAGVYIDPDKGRTPVKVYAKEWLARQQIGPRTYEGYDTALRLHVLPVIGSKTMAGVHSDDIEDVFTSMTKGGLAVSTALTRLIPVRSIFHHAVVRRVIVESPFRGADLPAMPSAAVDETQLPGAAEINAVSRGMPPEYALAPWLMAGCGLRIGEVCGVAEAHFRPGVLRVRQQVQRRKDKEGLLRPALVPLKHRQAGEWRDVPVPEVVADRLQWHVRRFGTGKDGLIFRSIRSKGLLSENPLRDAFTRARNAAGHEERGWTPHDFRHFFASASLAAGLPILDVSRWLGHKSITTTVDIYGHLLPDATERGARALHGVLSLAA